ncbi:hypothetical protein QEH59_01690 [Coraliomargarita sp. SDUM461004]|uniref:Antitoxin n=1 Tax=Thalassobacterium sedimentorum TaxID=3041258 RepID=A0ABU1AGY3_9BACT|nr:hypothetical protein [Coraliomargarita sp. SDUM461004]MDQ8193120.1 hypothetical protein [Coraliomargarita sp. SDUM461004]
MKEDNYEKELLEAEDDILNAARAPSDREAALLKEAAQQTYNKDKRINIRISSRDLSALQKKANRYGMPYQTLVSSVLHRYVTGDLTEVDS